MRKINLLFTVLLLVGSTVVTAQKKSDLRVLFVGGSSDYFLLGGVKADSVAQKKSADLRTASFGKLLNQYFKSVKVINTSEYSSTLSNDYDVTIFDGTPKPWREQKYLRDDKGRITKVIPAAYLPQDYNRPTLCIAEYSEKIGRSLGIKNDWYCLCLDKDAFGWENDHPIFNGPYKVALKPIMKATPEAAKEYAKVYNEQIPDSVEMFSIQHKGYSNNLGFRPGMVSRPDGYADSPDAENICGGVSIKSFNAVALGRHGNFFHWGFSAAPYDMTEEGKILFINSIVYISKFKEAPIAKKIDDRVSTRHNLIYMKYSVTKEAWQAEIQQNKEFAKMVLDTRKTALEKKAKGEELSQMESIYLDYKLSDKPDPTYSEYVKQKAPQLYAIFGDDAQEYAKYYEKNTPYFYGGEDGGLKIDDDVRTLGIGNNDIRILEKAISMLEKGEDTALATRVLHRYTLCRFETPAQWRQWFNSYKDKMFFTEGGGWVWLINTTDKSVPGNDYSVLNKKEDNTKAAAETAASVSTQTSAAPPLPAETDDKNPVMLAASINKGTNGQQEVVIRMKIHKGYHTYAQVSEKEPFIKTEIKIDIPSGYKKVGDLMLPVFKNEGSSGTTIFEGDCIFRQKISGSGSGEVKCTISYQCCDNSICFQPVEKVIVLKV